MAFLAEVQKDKIPGLIFEVKFLAKKRYYMLANIKELGQKETNVRLDFFSVETGLLVEEKDSVVENSQFALFKKFLKGGAKARPQIKNHAALAAYQENQGVTEFRVTPFGFKNFCLDQQGLNHLRRV